MPLLPRKARIPKTMLQDRRAGADMDVSKEIEAYERLKDELEAKQMGKWVLVKDAELVATYDEFDEAAKDAVRRFGRGPYLIRQVGAPSVTLPASLMYHVQAHAVR